jgi:two-component system cell cycle sensor histidine kinase/response regulator CckA
VADSGCGIPEELQARIFDPFFSTKTAGRGLGLAAVVGILHGHGGGLRLWSQPGQGTTFRIFLPVAAEPETSAASRGGQPSEGAATPATSTPGADVPGSPGAAGTPVGQRPASVSAPDGCVLLIDDEPFLRDVASRVLRAAGHTVLLAASGTEGLELFRRHADSVRLVLLDLRMPGMDGWQVLSSLHQLRPDVRVLLTTAYAEDGWQSRPAASAVAGVLSKPYKLDTLTEMVGRLSRLPSPVPK